MVEQLVLSLPVETALDAENFLISECNAAAVRLIQEWPQWPGRACVICGPAGCGKSHLVEVWRHLCGAQVMPASAIAGDRKFSGPLAVEDVDSSQLDERAFFHLLNSSREQGFDLLLTGRTAPGEWRVTLPDLRSRFRSLTVVRISEPDDELLRALLIKHFADRQLSVQPEVISYILNRIERSAAAAQTIVAAIDRLGFSKQKPVSRALVREVLERL